MKEDISQLTVNVQIKDLWKALSYDLRHVISKVLPDIVAEVELLEGDGGLGSMLLFKFNPNVPISSQKEKVVECDDSLHVVALEVLEGGHLDQGFSAFTTVFKLTEVSEAETLVDIKILYENKPEHTPIPGQNIQEAIHFINSTVNHLLKDRP